MRIPTGNFGNVTPQSNPTRVDVSNAGAIGNAVAGLGQSLGQATEDVKRTQDKADLAATQAILTDLDAKASDRWENPETGALVTRQGFKSSGVGQDMDKLDSGDYDQARANLSGFPLSIEILQLAFRHLRAFADRAGTTSAT